MYLVDTSVWIDFLRGKAGAHVDFLDGLLENPLAAGLSDAILPASGPDRALDAGLLDRRVCDGA